MLFCNFPLELYTALLNGLFDCLMYFFNIIRCVGSCVGKYVGLCAVGFTTRGNYDNTWDI